MLPSPAVSVIAAINHVLDRADWARERLQPFAANIVRISMLPFELKFVIEGDGRLRSSEAVPELDIVLPPHAPLLALQGKEQLMKAVPLKGPADLADALSFVLRNLRWDIEEDLSKVMGDVAAHRMVAALDAFAGWQRQAARNLGENVGEYLIEERQTLVKEVEFAKFRADVDDLGAHLARIETRIDKLRGS